MRRRRCIEEKGRLTLLDGRGPSVWHIIPKGAWKAETDWCPILCSDDEGITLPGYPEMREPTCPDCIEAARHRERRTTPTKENSK